ncbi:hypothetical protein ICP12012A_006 [Vibrio phage ICP1_2012_A]|nr:hypothetical protein ICP12012A_006 [Vibrio phage ICP1_2012_A]QVW04503.1 hypothetical protein 2018Mat001_0035 [Vibrio phage ICP1]QVW04727.1 hypothetical protein 2018Mat002_0030 [Vibrio phage ICP1]QVW05396.1 hypothetical protein 2018Mat160_0030 [Vibrio phage ICP1]QVW06745.1 hypothetical protein 2019Dha007_0030 [Vibrio phage ICP1]
MKRKTILKTNNNPKLWKQYRKIIEALPDYSGDFDHPDKQEYYQLGFETWVKLNNQYKYFQHQQDLIGWSSWYGI